MFEEKPMDFTWSNGVGIRSDFNHESISMVDTVISWDDAILSLKETEGLDERGVRHLISQKLQVIGDRLFERWKKNNG